MKKRVAITDTTLRDAHQSLLATRMRLEHVADRCPDRCHRLSFPEVWGGATFDSCLRFLNEVLGAATPDPPPLPEHKIADALLAEPGRL